MQLTASSTTYRDQRLARRLPPDLLHQVLADEDELQALRSIAGAVPQPQAKPELMVAAKQAVVREHVEQMAAKHSEQAQQRRQILAAAVHRLLDAEGEPLNRMTAAHRVKVVKLRLTNNPTKYGLPVGWQCSDRTKRIIRQAINSWYESKF